MLGSSASGGVRYPRYGRFQTVPTNKPIFHTRAPRNPAYHRLKRPFSQANQNQAIYPLRGYRILGFVCRGRLLPDAHRPPNAQWTPPSTLSHTHTHTLAAADATLTHHHPSLVPRLVYSSGSRASLNAGVRATRPSTAASRRNQSGYTSQSFRSVSQSELVESLRAGPQCQTGGIPRRTRLRGLHNPGALPHRLPTATFLDS